MNESSASKQNSELEKHGGREERGEKENIVLNIHVNNVGEMICVVRVIVYLLFVTMWGS